MVKFWKLEESEIRVVGKTYLCEGTWRWSSAAVCSRTHGAFLPSLDLPAMAIGVFERDRER